MNGDLLRVRSYSNESYKEQSSGTTITVSCVKYASIFDFDHTPPRFIVLNSSDPERLKG